MMHPALAVEYEKAMSECHLERVGRLLTRGTRVTFECPCGGERTFRVNSTGLKRASVKCLLCGRKLYARKHGRPYVERAGA